MNHVLFPKIVKQCFLVFKYEKDWLFGKRIISVFLEGKCNAQVSAFIPFNSIALTILQSVLLIALQI
jgi:hypothetical protein